MNQRLSFLLLASFLLGGCGQQLHQSNRIQWPTMGTIASVRCSIPEDAEAAKRHCETIFQQQEAIFSVWDASSELSQLNLTAGTGVATVCSEELSHVLFM